jgi:hypothetical protein
MNDPSSKVNLFRQVQPWIDMLQREWSRTYTGGKYQTYVEIMIKLTCHHPATVFMLKKSVKTGIKLYAIEDARNGILKQI